MRRLLPLLSLLFVGPALAAGPGDWSSVGRDAGSQRYSPLTQITPANVAGLKPAWTYHMNPKHDPKAPPSPRAPGSETTPLVVDGVMYFSTPYARVVALDAASGKPVWSYNLPAGEQTPIRGIGYWEGAHEAALEIDVGGLQSAQGGFGGAFRQRRLVSDLQDVGADDAAVEFHLPLLQAVSDRARHRQEVGHLFALEA